jgi:two-component system sensor histidine kinase KdpD
MTSPAQIAVGRPVRPPAWVAYGFALLLVAAASLVAVIVNRLISAPNLSLVFVLPVLIAAVGFGWGPALVAAVAGVVAYNFLLIPPLYTFRVADPANAWALALLMIAAALVSAVAAQSRRRALASMAAGARAEALQALARDLVGAADRGRIVRAGAEALSKLLQAPAVILWPDGDDMRTAAEAGEARISEADCEAARWALASRLPTRGGAYPVEAAGFDFWPVTTPLRTHLAVGVAISDADQGRPEAAERLVAAVTGYLSVALDREEYARLLLENRVQKASEALKTNLLAAVSHDLKTPLSTILVTLQTLRKFKPDPGRPDDARTREDLLALAETETARLSGMVANLLDMNRLDAGAVAVRAEPTSPTELTAEALRRAAPALAGRRIVNRVGHGARALLVDSSLFESALANVLENAGKYSSPGAEVRVSAGSDATMGWIEVLDEGPGFAAPPEALFERFARGVAGDGRPPGAGLGLSIAKGFLEAQGGRLEAARREDRPGAAVRLFAPLALPVAVRA